MSAFAPNPDAELCKDCSRYRINCQHMEDD